MKDRKLQEKLVNLCSQSIDLYQEYIDRHGYEPSAARSAALREVQEFLAYDMPVAVREEV